MTVAMCVSPRPRFATIPTTGFCSPISISANSARPRPTREWNKRARLPQREGRIAVQSSAQETCMSQASRAPDNAFVEAELNYSLRTPDKPVSETFGRDGLERRYTGRFEKHRV